MFRSRPRLALRNRPCHVFSSQNSVELVWHPLLGGRCSSQLREFQTVVSPAEAKKEHVNSVKLKKPITLRIYFLLRDNFVFALNSKEDRSETENGRLLERPYAKTGVYIQ